MNKVVLMSQLTKDPDIRYSSGDTAKPFVSFTLAVSRRSAGKGGRNEADFINCVVKPTALAVGYKTRPSNLCKQLRWTLYFYIF